MEFPEWMRGMATGVAKGLNLVPSERDRLLAEKARREKARVDVFDRKAAIEDDVRRLEARLLKLDSKRQAEHGVIARATLKEMQLAGVQLKAKETQLHEALDQIADLDLLIGQIEKILTGRPITAEDWDGVGVEREEQLAEESDAAKARAQVQSLGDRELRDLESEVDVDSILGEIRGTDSKGDAATEEILRQIKSRQATDPDA
jgi:hypothetical protein